MKAGEMFKAVAGMAGGILLFTFAAFAQKGAPATSAPAPSSGTAVQKAPAANAAGAKPAAKGTEASKPSSEEAEKGKNRDPFRSMIPEKKVATSEIPLRLPPGKKGLVIEQLTLQGIARGLDGSWIAVVDNKTKRAYFLHEKDELYNGVVSKITSDRIVFEEPATDAMGKRTMREVIRRLSGENEQ